MIVAFPEKKEVFFQAVMENSPIAWLVEHVFPEGVVTDSGLWFAPPWDARILQSSKFDCHVLSAFLKSS